MTKSQWAAFFFVLIVVVSQLGANAGVDRAAAHGGGVAPTGLVLAGPPPVGEPAQPLVELSGWLNAPGEQEVAAAQPSGSVRLVVFWSANCDYCLAALEATSSIAKRWGSQGLVSIAVHSPQSPSAADQQSIADAANSANWSRAIALDDDGTNFDRWQGTNRFWPRTYVVDQNGVIRFDHVGEGGYDELEATIAYLIENGP